LLLLLHLATTTTIVSCNSFCLAWISGNIHWTLPQCILVHFLLDIRWSTPSASHLLLVHQLIRVALVRLIQLDEIPRFDELNILSKLFKLKLLLYLKCCHKCSVIAVPVVFVSTAATTLVVLWKPFLLLGCSFVCNYLNSLRFLHLLQLLPWNELSTRYYESLEDYFFLLHLPLLPPWQLLLRLSWNSNYLQVFSSRTTISHHSSNSP